MKAVRSGNDCPGPVMLSICIATYNRAAFIGDTLDSIVPQLTDPCEIVILDSSANDDTAVVVAERARTCAQIRYIKQSENHGVDADYDRAVQLARGKYCWLRTDDDLLKPGAVAAVLEILERDVSLVIVNVEFRDFSMTRVIQPGWLDFVSDRTYGSGELERLFVEVGEALKYVGCVVIKREVWLARDRKKYYGSWFVYAGVIFQALLPSEAVVLANPYISYRMGNSQTFTQKISEILWDKWPSLLEASVLSKSSRSLVPSAEPWADTRELLRLRALGFYSIVEYRRWARPKLRPAERWKAMSIAIIPATIVNTLSVLYYSLANFHPRGLWLQEMRMSPWNLKNRMNAFRRRMKSLRASTIAAGSDPLS